MSPVIASRVLFLICLNPAVRTTISQYLTVYTFLKELLTIYPEFVVGVSGLVCHFPICAESAGLLVQSGLLEQLNVAAFSRGIFQEIWSVIVVHAAFDQYALPRDFRELIQYIKTLLWSDPGLTYYALATLYALSLYPDARRVILDLGLLERLRAGESQQGADYIPAIIANCIHAS
jgi:hypothetical protein